LRGNHPRQHSYHWTLGFLATIKFARQRLGLKFPKDSSKKVKFMRITAGYTLLDNKRNEDVLKELKIP
jgi:hypothetical protein